MDITVNELVQAIRGPVAATHSVRDARGELGQHIVVLDRGFVYVGQVTEEVDRIVIKDAKNIRYWGTKAGLGELRNGPLKETKLDDVGAVMAYRHAVIHMIPCKGF